MNRQRNGFTLIEVLIAVVILATGLVVILQGMHTAVSVLDAAVDKTRAAMLVRTQFSLAQQAAANFQDLSDLDSNGEFEKPYDLYRWNMSVERVSRPVRDTAAGDGAGDLFKVDVIVWRIGSEREYRAATYIYVGQPQAAASGGSISGNSTAGGER